MSKKENNIESEVMDVLSDHLNYDREKISLKSDIINDLGADSLDSVEVIMALEEKYDITISDTDAENVKTVEDLIKLIQEKVK